MEAIAIRSPRAEAQRPSFYEFFAGGGMARAGLGSNWECLFANDFDFKKSLVYRRNWGEGELVTRDVGKLLTSDLPGTPDLVWASFPCQDLSLAGMGAGLKGDRSGTFWPFWKLVSALGAEGRGPRLVVLENVCGTLTSHDGKDFEAITDALREAGYRFGAVVADASLFVPQSRPRLFIIAVAAGTDVPSALERADASARWHPTALRRAHARLPLRSQRNWIWWNLPVPPKRKHDIEDVIEENPTSVAWHSPEETERLLGMMNERNLAKVEAAKGSGNYFVGTVYKRTRVEAGGQKVQRAEIRFDGIAGCLRTSSGGSSRQLVVVVKGKRVRSRLLSSRETARLMGLPDTYELPTNYNEAYHLTGDGLVVPVVRHIARHVLEQILAAPASAVEQVA